MTKELQPTYQRPLSVFIDVDGIVLFQPLDPTVDGASQQINAAPQILPGVLEMFNKLSRLNCKIIITTARKESARQQTEDQLRKVGLFWDMLILGLPNGPRMVINDLKPGSKEATAIAVNLERNIGMLNLDIDEARRLQSTLIK